MRNARKFDDRITIGGVPDSEDLSQLKDLGYKKLVDRISSTREGLVVPMVNTKLDSAH